MRGDAAERKPGGEAVRSGEGRRGARERGRWDGRRYRRAGDLGRQDGDEHREGCGSPSGDGKGGTPAPNPVNLTYTVSDRCRRRRAK